MWCQEPVVEDFMTRTSVTLSLGDPISAAEYAMRLHVLRHLVVLDRGHVVGVVSERDVMRPRDPHEPDPAYVAEVMTPIGCTLRPDTPIEEAATALAEARYAVALVMVGDRHVGVFSATDALRILADTLADQRIGERARRTSRLAVPVDRLQAPRADP